MVDRLVFNIRFDFHKIFQRDRIAVARKQGHIQNTVECCSLFFRKPEQNLNRFILFREMRQIHGLSPDRGRDRVRNLNDRDPVQRRLLGVHAKTGKFLGCLNIGVNIRDIFIRCE